MFQNGSEFSIFAILELRIWEIWNFSGSLFDVILIVNINNVFLVNNSELE